MNSKLTIFLVALMMTATGQAASNDDGADVVVPVEPCPDGWTYFDANLNGQRDIEETCYEVRDSLAGVGIHFTNGTTEDNGGSGPQYEYRSGANNAILFSDRAAVTKYDPFFWVALAVERAPGTHVEVRHDGGPNGSWIPLYKWATTSHGADVYLVAMSTYSQVGLNFRMSSMYDSWNQQLPQGYAVEVLPDPFHWQDAYRWLQGGSAYTLAYQSRPSYTVDPYHAGFVAADDERVAGQPVFYRTFWAKWYAEYLVNGYVDYLESIGYDNRLIDKVRERQLTFDISLSESVALQEHYAARL